MDNNNYKDMADSKIASFDHTYSTNHIRMLKIFMHYIPAAFRKNLTVYIKFLELQHTLAFYADSSDPSSTNSENTPNFSMLIQELLPFCTPREKQQFQSMENMMNSFEQMKSMMEMMEMMKDMKDMFGDEEGGFNPEMLAGMMGMDGFNFGDMFGSST